MAKVIRYSHAPARQALHTETAMFKCIGSFLLTCLFWVPMIKLSNPILLMVACVLSGVFWSGMYVVSRRRGYLFFPPAKSYRNELGNFAQGVLVLMVFFGFLIVGIAIQSVFYNVSLLLFGHNTYGIVTRQEEEWTRVQIQTETSTRNAVYEDRLVYFAIVEIKVDEGVYEIRASTAGGAPRYPTGSEVKVLYLSGNPGRGRIKREVQSPWGELSLALFGIVIIGAACFVMVIQGAWSVPEPISAWFKKQIEKRFSGTVGAEHFAAREDSSQFAVGAIITDYENEKYLLVHTGKSPERQTASASDSGEWNFLKGGLLSPQESRRSALLNVLRGKTGSVFYTILEEFEETLTQQIAQDENSPSITQEITMYLVTYTGDGTDFSPQNETVEQLDFFPPEEALKRISTEESQAFFEKYVMSRLAEEKAPEVV